MMIHDITAMVGPHKKRKRVGRGPGSGGKRAGRGQKGAGSRSGNSAKKAFEGGQMPYFRRLRKAGFTNVNFRTMFWAVNLRDIVAHPSFAKGGDVDAAGLIAAGLIRDTSRDLKILGDTGEKGLKVALNVTASRVTGGARKAIESAGGSVNETGSRRDRVRGIDRNADEPMPTNLTKKMDRYRRRMEAKAGGGAAAQTAQP